MRIIAIILGLVMAANGVVMLAAPEPWYHAVPGVADTGHFNIHFVRDIGIAYVVAGAAIAWGAFGAGWAATALGAAFLAGHAALHAIETIAGQHHDVLLNEIAGVHAPAIIAVLIAVWQRRASA
jgi:uncharacterized protein YjeT (DUF2065 family)